MNINSLDLNLLLAFVAIDRERNITLAAEHVGLSQPALSNALARLRKLLNDPLFVRTAKGMEPTPYAVRLSGPIRKACELIDGALKIDASFDPTRTSRKFSVYMTDIGEAVMLPRLLRHLQTFAPRIGINIETIPKHGIQEAMTSGDVDLAVGLFEGLGGGFFEQRLYRDDFVCIVRADHPTVGNTFSQQQFIDLPHVLVSSGGTGHEAAIEKIVVKQRVKRSVALSVPHFLALPAIVAQTDATGTVPRKLALSFMNSINIKLLTSPIKFPTIEIKQHWHARYHHDPANKWLRSVFAELFSERNRRSR
ncbi:MAG TPA: LysR family transcriptional regulator [Xanthobacteraceae bacterium]|jgi:DNA-binding transcriptional LysR family regulator